MSGTKIVVVVLVLIVVLFVLFVVWGSTMDRGKTAGQDPQGKEFGSTPHPTMAALNQVLSPFAPKLKAEQMDPSLTTYDLAPGSVHTIRISADHDHKFRQATFVVLPDPSCAQLVYETSQDDGGSGLKRQDSHDPNTKYKNDPDPQFTFTILEQAGGMITITRPPLSPGSCRVMLK